VFFSTLPTLFLCVRFHAFDFAWLIVWTSDEDVEDEASDLEDNHQHLSLQFVYADSETHSELSQDSQDITKSISGVMHAIIVDVVCCTMKCMNDSAINFYFLCDIIATY
jgi:hypothetical protein